MIRKCERCGAPATLEDEATSFTCEYCNTVTEVARTPEPPSRSDSKGKTPTWPFAVAGFVLVVLGISYSVSMDRIAAKAEARVPAPVPVPVPSPVPVPPQVAAPVPQVTHPAGPDPKLVELDPVVLTWTGKVRSSSGDGPRNGAPCTFTVKAHRDPGSDRAREDFSVLSCGGKVLYDSQQPLNGMSSHRFGLNEMPVADEVSVFQYAVVLDDTGNRSGDRNQISLESPKGLGEAVRDGLGSFRVSVTIDALSAVRRGKPLFDDSLPPFAEVVRRKARVVSATGAKPFAGSVCDFSLSPGDKEHNCRAKLTCAGKVLLGSGTAGFQNCTLAGGKPVSLLDAYPTDKDHDPELNVNLETASLVLADSTARSSYTVTFKLE